MDNKALYEKLCRIEELLQMVFMTQDWNPIGDKMPEEDQWIILVDHIHENPVQAQYSDGKLYYGDYLNFVAPEDYEGYWLPTQRGGND